MARDPHRPAFHFSPDLWMNDPIPFFDERDGRYHVFFQHNPNAPEWGDMTWGHAASADLVRWERLPNAIERTPGGPDADGVWTGCVVRDDVGVYHAFYTGIPTLRPLVQVQCRATSRDLVTWEKPADDNPIIARQPPGFGECFRDPHVWREADGWYMVVGSELPDRAGGAALLYRSDDLARWTYLHPLATGEAGKTNHDFECPDFFPLGNRHVLLSSRDHTFWQTGTYDAATRRFEAADVGRCDTDAFYAAKTLVDGRGRRILFGWVKERRPREAQLAAGWSGVLSLPRVMTLGDDGRPRFAPPEELRALRGQRRAVAGQSVTAAAGERRVRVIDGIEGDAIELVVRLEPSDAAVFGLRLRAAGDGSGGADVLYDRAAGTLCGVPFELAPGEPLTLRAYVDRSVIEVFANDRACRTLRIYPSAAERSGAVVSEGGTVNATAVEAWDLAP